MGQAPETSFEDMANKEPAPAASEMPATQEQAGTPATETSHTETVAPVAPAAEEVK